MCETQIFKDDQVFFKHLGHACTLRVKLTNINNVYLSKYEFFYIYNFRQTFEDK